MKEQVLKTMVSVVDELMQFGKSDFYRYDLKALASADEKAPFLWSVRKSATTLLMMDISEETERLNKSESYRFQFMKNPTLWVENFAEVSQWSESVFYYDGEELQEIPVKAAPAYAKDIFMPVVEKLKGYVNARFAQKDGDYNAKVDVHFTPDAFSQVLEIARTDEGAELLKTLRRFRHYSRRSRNHKIGVACDFVNKSFYFQEIVADTRKMNGGIIYNGGHWTIHT